MKRRAPFLSAFAVLLALGAACPARAAAPDLAAVEKAKEFEKAVVDCFARVVPAYVFIGGGSGVLISPDGLMLTNDHVIAQGGKVWTVRVEKKWFKADLLGTDTRGDIALLKLRNAQGLEYVEMADSDKLRVGQQVIAVGNPFGTAEMDGQPTVTMGIVSAVHRFMEGYSDAIQTDAPINPGNSGGPLLTLDGKLVGINGRINTRFGARSNTGIGLAIPTNQIRRFIPFLKEAKGGKVHHGVLRGLVGDHDEADGIQNGAEIKEVLADSAAEKLGFKAGDRITHVEDQKLLNYNRFLGVVGTYPAGANLKLKLEREGKSMELDAPLEPLVPGSLAFQPKQAPLNTPIVVDKVYPNLAAAKGGILPGDTILSVNGEDLPNLFSLMAFGQKMQDSTQGRFLLAGDEIKVKVKRGEGEKVQELDLDVTLTSAEDNPRQPRPQMRRPPRRPAPQPAQPPQNKTQPEKQLEQK
ncbi:MAG: trypsin-like peptidase domain-containing protein [Planctomycetota bacterium]|nr:trypsin-like peptidase domain-containing protein [Planctomycetota bacterium]